MAVAALVWPAPGCGGGAKMQPGATDGATADQVAVDRAPPSDAAPLPAALALDFSATGCAVFDPVVSRCDGTAPVTLSFTPIASAELTRFLWTFGDDTPDSSERSPVHTYTLPGTYRVTLVGLAPGVGSLQQSHADYVNVLPAPVGAWCDVDMQCADQLGCWCGASTPCVPPLSRGLCSRPCDIAVADAGAPSNTVCPSGTTCADLSPGGPAPAAAAAAASAAVPPGSHGLWRRALCLPSCASDADCAAGFRCRALRAAPPAIGWTRACFADYPLEIGVRCGDALGNPVDADCASRQCAALGAYHRCAADCTTTACPSGSSCAHFGDGRRLCLAACRTATGTGGAVASDAGTAMRAPACDDDPLLSCEAAGTTGPLGFTVTGATSNPADSPATYCAPRRCLTSSDCGTAGSCPTGGGHCQRIATP